MRIETINVKVFKPEELDTEQLCEKYRYRYLVECWWEYAYDRFVEKMKKEEDFCVEEMRFSGFYSQGDYAFFEGYSGDSQILLQKFLHIPYIKESIFDSIVVKVDSNNIDVIVELQEENDCDIKDYLETKIEEVMDDLVEWQENKNNELYEMLKEEYEGLLSDEYVIQGLIEEGLEFTEDFKIFN